MMIQCKCTSKWRDAEDGRIDERDGGSERNGSQRRAAHVEIRELHVVKPAHARERERFLQ